MENGAILVKRRVHDEVLRGDIASLMRKADKHLVRREELLKESQALIKEAKRIKIRSIEEMGESIFRTAKNLKAAGLEVFIAKKPIDVAEYVRGIIDKERLGVVPSTQTMEAEIMQAFFVSNKACVLSKKYAGHEKGQHYVHPLIPYSHEAGEFTKPSVNYSIISALAISENGDAFVEQDELDVLNNHSNIFVIVTMDRIFKAEEIAKVATLMEISSGGAIRPMKTRLRGRVILLDNGRIALSRSGLKDILMCINCYSCSLYCPVYLSIGALFGSPSMAAIGALSAGYQSGIKAAKAKGLEYCTLCKKCDKECPVEVPLTELVQKMREKAHSATV